MTLTPVALVDELLAEDDGGVDGSLGGALAGAAPAAAVVGSVPTRSSERAASLRWLRDNGLPDAHDEAWKYTPLKELMARPIDRVATIEDGRTAVVGAGAATSIDGGPVIVVVDGVYRADLSSGARASGIRVLSISAATDGVDGGPADTVGVDSLPVDLVDPGAQARPDGFGMLNRGFAVDGIVIDVPPRTSVDSPVHVVHLAGDTDDALLVQPRVDIHVGEGSTVTIVESFLGSRPTAFVNAGSTVVLERDALLRHYKIQSQAVGSVHLSSIRVRQETGSSLKAGAFMFGGSIARQSIDVLASGDRTTTDLYGLYLPKGSQRFDNLVTVQHAGRHGASHQTYKGVMDDHARGSFSGHIIVDQGTVGTDAHQSNKTLLLDPTAQSDSRPWLEIFADDVDCTHGSAIGQLDERSLFYMRSRGIPLVDARAILVGGFINEIVEKLLTESVREMVMGLVKEQVRSGYTAELGGDD